MRKITHEEFIDEAIVRVADYESKREDIKTLVTVEDVFTVWSCKTLQNSKALLSAKHKGAYYYEFTLNGDKGEIYMDVYKKQENIKIMPINL